MQNKCAAHVNKEFPLPLLATNLFRAVGCEKLCFGGRDKIRFPTKLQLVLQMSCLISVLMMTAKGPPPSETLKNVDDDKLMHFPCPILGVTTNKP